MDMLQFFPLDGGLMQEKGSSLLKILQSNEMPDLDLLVRESVQNSLDAAEKTHEPVIVSFNARLHAAEVISRLLPEIAEQLNDTFTEKQYIILEIRDKGTCGLTGHHSAGFKGYDTSRNLVKLVYEISQTHDTRHKSEAGGSWGLGKTVYYRFGAGLVFYYSRIKLSHDDFEERLVCCLVENEKSPNRLMKRSQTGIAWWGGQNIVDSDGKMWPAALQDSELIHETLNALDIKPFVGNDTGTSVIIPFIASESLLSGDIRLPDSGSPAHPLSSDCMAGLITDALLKWYCVRLENQNFPNGPALEASVNGKNVGKHMPPLFRIIRMLYNKAACPVNFELDEFPELKDDLKLSDIKLNATFASGPYAGWLTAVEVSAKQLGMEAPDNERSPWDYLLSGRHISGRPFLGYLRKPGMIVSWGDNEWVTPIDSETDDRFILALFVPNPDARFTKEQQDKIQQIKKKEDDLPILKLEEYLRSIEKADHAIWRDPNGLNFISKISGKVQSEIKKHFADEPATPTPSPNLTMSRLLADIFLPKNFGDDGREQGLDRPLKPDNKPTAKKTNPHLDLTIQEYGDRSLKVTWEIYWGKSGRKSTSLDIAIDTETIPISRKSWEEDEMPGDFPFMFSDFAIETINNGIKGQNPSISLCVSHNDANEAEDTRMHLTMTRDSVTIQNRSGQSMDGWTLYGTLTVRIQSHGNSFTPIIRLTQPSDKKETDE